MLGSRKRGGVTMTGARSSQDAQMWTGTKRSLTTPTSPEGIAKAAKLQWTTEREK